MLAQFLPYFPLYKHFVNDVHTHNVVQNNNASIEIQNSFFFFFLLLLENKA